MPNIEFDGQSRPALAPWVRLQIDPVKKTPVLLYPEGLLELNDTAHEVITRCDGQNTIAQILYSLGEEFAVNIDVLRDDVLNCLSELQRRQLIVFRS